MEYCAGGDLAALIKKQRALVKEAKNKSDPMLYVPEEVGWKLLA